MNVDASKLLKGWNEVERKEFRKKSDVS